MGNCISLNTVRLSSLMLIGAFQEYIFYCIFCNIPEMQPFIAKITSFDRQFPLNIISLDYLTSEMNNSARDCNACI